jgi:hypothetical protein
VLSRRLVAAAQAAYYVPTGIWPFVHRRSFLAVTGPKAEMWLVETVALLVCVIGGVLGRAAWRDKVVDDHALLGAGAAVALGGIDMVYGTRGRIRRTYLLDAVAEAGLLAGWLVAGDGRAAGTDGPAGPRAAGTDEPAAP